MDGGLSVHRTKPRAHKIINLHDEITPGARDERLKDGDVSEFRGMWKFLTNNFQHVIDDAGQLFEHEGGQKYYRRIN